MPCSFNKTAGAVCIGHYYFDWFNYLTESDILKIFKAFPHHGRAFFFNPKIHQ